MSADVLHCPSNECQIRGTCTSASPAYCRNVLSDFSLVAPNARLEPQWSAYLERMRGKRYGAEATLVAWLWFLDGWNARGG